MPEPEVLPDAVPFAETRSDRDGDRKRQEEIEGDGDGEKMVSTLILVVRVLRWMGVCSNKGYTTEHSLRILSKFKFKRSRKHTRTGVSLTL